MPMPNTQARRKRRLRRFRRDASTLWRSVVRDKAERIEARIVEGRKILKEFRRYVLQLRRLNLFRPKAQVWIALGKLEKSVLQKAGRMPVLSQSLLDRRGRDGKGIWAVDKGGGSEATHREGGETRVAEAGSVGQRMDGPAKR